MQEKIVINMFPMKKRKPVQAQYLFLDDTIRERGFEI